MTTTWLTLISSLGAAIVGGLIAPLIGQRRERLQARAEVRRSLTKAEVLRFLPGEYRDFTHALAAVEASAMLAGLPRRVVSDYVHAVTNFREAVEFHPDVGDNGEGGWGITHGPVTEMHEQALERLGHYLWHPWLARLRHR